ncbi:MAG TPA: hypothetical protein VGA03_02855, partial [Anaerolineales bacterium]
MEDVLELARQEGTPLIDGETVAFVWQGKRAPDLVADFTSWLSHPVSLQKVAKNAWIHSLRLPRNAYLEYAFLDPVSEARFIDPFNFRTTPNGYGEFNNYFYMPEAHPTDLIRRRRGVARGVVTRHAIPTGGMVSGVRRTVHLYRPPSTEPSPLLVVLDGPDYLRRGKIVQIVDNLIDQERIRPLALALVTSGGPARLAEYSCSESSLVYLKDSLLPFACRQLELVDHAILPGAQAVMGMSGSLKRSFLQTGKSFPCWLSAATTSASTSIPAGT